MIWVILIIAIVIIAFKLGNKTGEMVSSSASSGGMRTKYAKLLEHILKGHPDSYCTRPANCYSSDKMYRWSWDNLKLLFKGYR